jgi:hypothetical protein
MCEVAASWEREPEEGEEEDKAIVVGSNGPTMCVRRTAACGQTWAEDPDDGIAVIPRVITSVFLNFYRWKNVIGGANIISKWGANQYLA